MTDCDAARVRRFFDDCHSTFLRAEEATRQTIELDHRIGGGLLRLRFAGPALVNQVAPAIAHLAVAPTANRPDLTVCVWDSRSSRSEMPAPPWPTDASVVRREVRGLQSDEIRCTFDVDAGILCLFDRERKLALYWTRDAGATPWYERAAPLLAILNGWLAGLRRQIVHAAAVGVDGRGVLLAGRGGSGKSTTAIACLAAGMSYASDDYCLMSGETNPAAFSLYSTAKLDTDSMRRLPELAAEATPAKPTDGEKAVLFLHPAFADRIASFPIRAILLPRVTGRPKSAVRRASAAEALRGLAPSTVLQLNGAGQTALAAMAEWVRAVPCHHLELGVDLAEVVATVRRVASRG